MIVTRRIPLLLLATLCSLMVIGQQRLTANGQRRLTVVDVETLVPIQGVNVASRGLMVQTDSMGCFVVVDSCRSLVFSHVNYESRIVNIEEVRDTVFLISKLLRLQEVVVFGKGKPDDTKKLNERLGLRLSKEEIQAINMSQNKGGNLLELVNHLIPKKWKEKWRRNTKEGRRERLRQILSDY